MIWNVFCEDFNNSSIIKYNIFNHKGFVKDVNNAIK